jgi:hypothetical protein
MQRISLCVLYGAVARACRVASTIGLTAVLVLALLAAAMAAPPKRSKKTPPDLSAPSPPPKVEKLVSSGIYTDRTGTKHNWQIKDTKTLFWDAQPYLPVGGAFAPHSFLTDGDAAWQEDVAALSTLKSKGLLDLLIWPGKPLPEIPVASFQRLVDYLDANGFRYGLAFGPGMTTQLSGTIVKPATYRFDDKDSLTAAWTVPDADSGLVVQLDPDNDSKIIRNDIIPTRDSVISVPVEPPDATSKVITLLFPHKVLPTNGDGDLPDLWAGFDTYRDRLLAYMGQIKFGRGLRFFLDPLARHIGLLNETDYLVPESTEFQLEWEAYLARRYPNAEEMKFAWSLNEGDFKTHQELARLVPLWSNGRGAPYFYDPSQHRFFRILDAQQSRWWQDFLQYRNESILYYLNAMADVLKHQVADVPVVVTWTQSHPIFSNTDTEGGYDGLGIAARGASLISRVAGPAYSEADQAARTIWCVTTEMAGTPEAFLNSGGQPRQAALQPGGLPAFGGYASQRLLFKDLDALKTVGIKGFFVSGFQTNPDDATQGATDWVRNADALDWLHNYTTQLDQGKSAADYTPHILFFPQNAPGPARIGPIPSMPNVLWMESFYSGELQDWWPSYSGYILKKQEGDSETVLVSLQPQGDQHGARDKAISTARATHIWVPDPKQVQATRPDGTPVPVKITDKHEIVVALDETPTVFHANGQQLVPLEASTDAMIQLSALMAFARSQNVDMANGEELSLERAQYAYRMKDFDTAYTYSRAALDQLTLSAKPYIWLEGEDTRYSTFTEVAPNAAASSGAYLRLSTPNPPGRLPYGVFYLFDVLREDKYDIWLAGTPPGPGTSPIQWRINQDLPQAPADSTPRGPLYLNDRFGWFKLGTVTLKKGDRQRLTIYVTDRAMSPPNYIFSIDTILIIPSSRNFTPNGKVRPLPMSTDAVRAVMHDQRLFGNKKK